MPVQFMALVPLGAAAWTDWREKRIPDSCAFLVASCGLLGVVLNGWPLEEALWGLVLLGGVFLLCGAAVPANVGGGDIKLCAALGLLLGPLPGMLMALFALMLTVAWGGLVKVKAVPLAPFLLVSYLMILIGVDCFVR